MDFIENIPDKTIILMIEDNNIQENDWATLEMYNEKLNFVLCIRNLHEIKTLKNHNLKFYWEYPITTYFELQSIIPLEPAYILLGAPLSFELSSVKTITEIPLRLIANVAHNDIIPRDNGIQGAWIRPEDVKEYETYIDVLEFSLCNLAKEATLLHVYKENQNWPGNLNLLFENFNVNVDNRAINEDLGKRRMNCGQRCLRSKTCHFCELAVNFAEQIRKLHEENNNN